MAPKRTRLLAGVLASLLPAGGAAPLAAPPAAPSVGEGAMLEETGALVRALTDARHAPPVTIGFRRRLVDAAEMRAAAAAVVRDAYSPGEIAVQQKMWQRFGLLPEGADYLTLLERSVARHPTGFYDPDARRLYVPDWIDLPEQRSTLAHELAHALQDQRFGLRRFLQIRSADAPAPDFDATLARQALVEGDAAVLAMEAIDARGAFPSPGELDAIERRMRAGAIADDRAAPAQAEPPPTRAGGAVPDAGSMASSLAAALPASAPVVTGFPRAIQAFPYVEGFSFVADLRGTGSWSAVDALWSQPPESTAEILHPEKLARREPPLVIAATPLRALAAGHAATHVDTLGEYFVRLWLEPAASAEVVERAAAGWRGDRIAVYLPLPDAGAAGVRGDARGDALLAWLTVWDSDADADDFLRVAGVRLAQLAGKETTPAAAAVSAAARAARAESSEGRIAVRQEGAGLLFAAQRQGERVALLLGAPEGALPALGAMLDDWKASSAAPPASPPRAEAGGHVPGAPARSRATVRPATRR